MAASTNPANYLDASQYFGEGTDANFAQYKPKETNFGAGTYDPATNTLVPDPGVTQTLEQKQQQSAIQNNKCACCNSDIDPDNTSSYEGDHIIEHSKGGKTELNNCEVLCLSCHQIKSKTPDVYKKMREAIQKVTDKLSV